VLAGDTTLQSLHENSLNQAGTNFTGLLADLAKQQKFAVNYIDLKERSYYGKRLIDAFASDVLVAYPI